jgi:hypothetical protein
MPTPLLRGRRYEGATKAFQSGATRPLSPRAAGPAGWPRAGTQRLGEQARRIKAAARGLTGRTRKCLRRIKSDARYLLLTTFVFS